LNKDNSAKLEYFSPLLISLELEIKDADVLVINQNYYPGWHSDRGEVVNHFGLLGIRISSPGTSKIRLWYAPETFILGLMISSVTWIVIAYLVFFRKLFSLKNTRV